MNPTHQPTNAPDPAQPTNAAPVESASPTPQTRGQNPDRSHEGADHGDAVTTTPDDATSRGGYGGSAQGEYDNRDGAPLAEGDASHPEGGGHSDPAPTNATAEPGSTDGYTNAAARQGATAQGIGSRGGSYNDQYEKPDGDRGHGAAPNQASAEPATGPDSGGASTGRS